MIRKVLVLSSNPKGTSTLALDLEKKRIHEAFKKAKKRSQFKLEIKEAVTAPDLQMALLEVKPQIVHFCGHGDGEAGLIFENEIGYQHRISTEALDSLFRIIVDLADVECVLLNACYSEAQAIAIANHVDYVIGMQRAIYDHAAIAFTEGFYNALGTGVSIEKAYECGCNLIQLMNDSSTVYRRSEEMETREKAYLPQHLIPQLFKNLNLTRITALELETTPTSETPVVEPTLPSQSVNTGLNALVDLISNALIKSDVVAFRTDFQAACEQIEVLSTYKDLHDQLHHLEFQCYRMIVQEARHFPDDETALDNLSEYLLTLQQIRENIRDIIQRCPFLSSEIPWLNDLDRTQTELQNALDNIDKRQLQKAISLLNRVLAIQPSRINTSLNTAAKALRLPTLAQTLTKIRDKLINTNLDAEKIEEFRTGVNALTELEKTLTELIESHDRWQEIDLELKRIQATLDKDTFELELFWLDLKAMVEVQYQNCEEEWALSLRKEAENLDQAITDNNAAKIRRYFFSYRRRASDRFYRVDVNLKRFCGNLRRVGEPLTSVLRILE